MSDAICEYPGCNRAVVRACDRCRRQFCSRHIEPLYPDVSAERSPWRCRLCTQEARQEARQHTTRSKSGMIWAAGLVLLGIVITVIGTALAPSSDRVTLAALAGLLIAGIGVISFLYSLVAR